MIAAQTEFLNHTLANYFYMRTAFSTTLLDFSKCTNPVAASRSALITAIRALYNPSLVTSLTLERIPSFSIPANRVGFNLLNSDGNLYCDHGNAAQSTIFRSNNGATTQMTVSDTQTLVPRLQVSAAAATNALVLGTTNQLQIQYATLAASRVVTIPDPGAAANFVMTAAPQTIGGVKTFSSGVPITATTNQLVLGVTNTTTLTCPAPTASRVYTIVDAGAAATINPTVDVTFAPAFTGPFTTAPITFRVRKRGNLVSIAFPQIQATSTAAAVMTASTALPNTPVNVRPITEQTFSIRGINNGVIQNITARIQISGVITFSLLDGSAFSATGTCGTSATTLTYDLGL
jgi:hypothetical protein